MLTEICVHNSTVSPGKYPFQDIFLVLRWFAHAAQGGLRPGAAPPARGAPALAWPTTLAWRWRPSFACRHLLGKWTRKLLFSSSDHEELKMLRLHKNWHLICCVLWAVISVLATIPITATENPNLLSSITADSSEGNLLKCVDNLLGAAWICLDNKFMYLLHQILNREFQ